MSPEYHKEERDNDETKITENSRFAMCYESYVMNLLRIGIERKVNSVISRRAGGASEKNVEIDCRFAADRIEEKVGSKEIVLNEGAYQAEFDVGVIEIRIEHPHILLVSEGEEPEIVGL